ncbi:MAG: DNA polymerase IV [Promethearchaeota archaeon]
MERIIFHCDLDCFFAAVEMRDNPALKGKPVIIGADPRGGKGRGVVSTCNYEARKYGLHSAMPISQAYNRCPHGIYLRPNGEKYLKASKEVMNILRTYSKDFQRLGADEAYLEFTEIISDYKEAYIIAKEIQEEIFENVGITISIGIAPTKSIAKIASDENKPNGITVVKPEDITEFLENMNITRIPGIGKKSKIHYNKKGIKTIGDIINTPLSKFKELFGINGVWAWKVAHGIDSRKVKVFSEGRKSISAERTFYEDTNDFNIILKKLEEINEKLHKQLIKHHISYKTITLKIRFKEFDTFTRSKSFNIPIQNKKIVLKTIIELFNEFKKRKSKVRLVGIKLSNFERDLKKTQTCILNFTRI